MMKLGQYLHSRPDILPDDSIAPSLADLCVSFDTDDIAPPCVAGYFIDPEPFAAASIANIYRGFDLESGDEVVVKVKRAGVDDDVSDVCDSMQWWSRAAAFLDGPSLEMTLLIDDYTTWIRKEVDFVSERLNLDEFRGMRTAIVPIVRSGTPSNIVMSYEPSKPSMRRELAYSLMDAFIEQIAIYGKYHADLHIGNVGESVDGDLIIYDFASIRPFPQPHSIPPMLSAFLSGDPDELATIMLENGILIGPRRDAILFCAQLLSYMDERSDVETLAKAIISERIDVRPSKSMAAFLRAFALVEGTCRRIDPGFDTGRAIAQATISLSCDSRFHRRELARFVSGWL